MVNILPISEVRIQLPKLVEAADSISRKTYISVKGRVKAAIVSTKELEMLEETVEVLADPKAMEAIKKGKRQAKNGKLVSWKELKEELGL